MYVSTHYYSIHNGVLFSFIILYILYISLNINKINKLFHLFIILHKLFKFFFCSADILIARSNNNFVVVVVIVVVITISIFKLFHFNNQLRIGFAPVTLK